MPNFPKVEFIILKISLVPYVHSHYPRITMSRKRHRPSGSIHTVKDWFERVMNKELMRLLPHTHISFTEWNILSGNMELFKVNGYRFDRLILVFGEEAIHWVYYQNIPIHRRMEGCGNLCVSFCSCCLNNQYINIVQAIIKHMELHGPF